MRKEHQEWHRPEDVTTQEFVGHVALEESPSDLAGQVVAALVSSSLALLEYDITERSQSTSLVCTLPRDFAPRPCMHITRNLSPRAARSWVKPVAPGCFASIVSSNACMCLCR